MELCGIVWNCVELYVGYAFDKIVQDYAGSYRIAQDYTGSYRIIHRDCIHSYTGLMQDYARFVHNSLRRGDVGSAPIFCHLLVMMIDKSIVCILVFASCIIAVGALRLNSSVKEHFATPSLNNNTQDLLLDPMLPMTKNEITATKQLNIGSTMNMTSTENNGIFKINNDTAFAMKRGGYLGVGTLNPTSGLDITSTTGKNLSISLNDSLRKYRWSLRMRDDAPDMNTNPDGALMIASDMHNEPSGVMYLKRTGQVGLGTDAPAAKLHIETGPDDDNGIIVSNAKHSQNATLSTTQDGSQLVSSGTLNLSANNGSSSVYVTHDDKNSVAFGIGIPMPTESLHATGNARIEGGSILLGGGAGTRVNRGAFVSRNSNGTTIEQPGASSIMLRTNNADRVTVSDDGLVKLHGDVEADGIVTVKGIKLGDLTISNSKGKLQVCAEGQPSSCRNI